MLCKQKTTLKYMTRKSPAYNANDPACQGKTLPGNDHKLYESASDKNGIYRWKLVKNDKHIEDSSQNHVKRHFPSQKKKTKKKETKKKETKKKGTKKKETKKTETQKKRYNMKNKSQ